MKKTPYDSDPSKATDFMEHLRRSFHYTIDHLGPHKLPLIGRADWNDCLNLNCFSTEPGESFQTFGPSEGPNAESVFIAGMFVRYGKDYVEICRHRGLEDEAKLAENAIAEMEKTVLDAGWDGEWFLRAYDHYKNKIGSKECEDGKIFIEPQGFCVMAEIGLKEGNCLKAMESVEKYLDTKYGIVLLQPPYHRYHVELGEISSYPPGYKEKCRYLLPQQSLDFHCRNRCRTWKPCMAGIYKNLSCIYRRYQRNSPYRTLCIFADDCRKRCSNLEKPRTAG